MSQTLLVIDVQNDYFPGGRYPLWNADAVLATIERAIQKSTRTVLVQHVAPAGSPFFEDGTEGAAIHPRIRAAAPTAPIVTKSHADAFHQTDLAATLEKLGTTDLDIAGMMTQNCVVFTALSPAARPFDVRILGDACTTVSDSIHDFALRALATRVRIGSV